MATCLRTCVALSAGLAWIAAAHAQDNIDCGYPLNAAERSFCADKALNDAEANLETALDGLRKKLVEMDVSLADHLKGGPAALDEAQAAWVAYRDKDCTSYAFPFRGGTRGEDLYRSCMIVLTMQRTADLNATLEDYGN